MINQVRRLLGIETKSSSPIKALSIDWVLPGKLAVGRLPQPGDSTALLKANIKFVLTLCAEQEGALPKDITDNFQCLRLVLPDRFYTNEMTVEQLAEAVTVVRQNLEKSMPTYVHCLAGIERSPTVCIAYLCKYEKMELWEAANWLKQVHPNSLPHPAALRAIREFIAPVQEDSRDTEGRQ